MLPPQLFLIDRFGRQSSDLRAKAGLRTWRGQLVAPGRRSRGQRFSSYRSERSSANRRGSTTHRRQRRLGRAAGWARKQLGFPQAGVAGSAHRRRPARGRPGTPRTASGREGSLTARSTRSGMPASTAALSANSGANSSRSIVAEGAVRGVVGLERLVASLPVRQEQCNVGLAVALRGLPEGSVALGTVRFPQAESFHSSESTPRSRRSRSHSAVCQAQGQAAFQSTVGRGDVGLVVRHGRLRPLGRVESAALASRPVWAFGKRASTRVPPSGGFSTLRPRPTSP